MRIVFMGTPEFAVPSLDALLKGPDQVVGIVTQPDRPKGRGQVLTPSPVKLIAQRERIPLLQPTKMKDGDFIATLSSWKPDYIAVAAFVFCLPQSCPFRPLAVSMYTDHCCRSTGEQDRFNGPSSMAKPKPASRPC
jgi:methionyl-tRNA formyltransferase